MIQSWVKVDAYIKSDDIMKKYWLFRSDFWCWAAWKTIHDPKWEFNWPFEFPIIYIKEWLPFCKNTCQNYHWYDPNLLPHLTNKVYANGETSDISNKRNNKTKKAK
jgi:hypothetical protein